VLYKTSLINQADFCFPASQQKAKNKNVLCVLNVLGLIGVLVNDSLVMVAYLNRLKLEKGTDSEQRGKHLSDQEISDGASRRLRAIVITSLTTCAGLFPAAYGIAGSNPFITPMVMAMFWGILFGTLMSLILLPCLYAAEQDLRKLFRRPFIIDRKRE